MKSLIKYRSDLKQKARKLRHDSTPAEKFIWIKILRNRQLLGYKFIRQKPIGNFVVDFFCSKLKLAIEIDGHTHDIDSEYDKQRTIQLNSLGIEVVRYSNSDVLKNIEGVYCDLMERVKNNEKYF